jgi:sulfate adenylyltransferase subunit 1
MVVSRGEHCPWYDGPVLLDLLETLDLDQEAWSRPFRFPVQLVCRPRTEEQRDYRGFMGRVESGRIEVGDPVTILPRGVQTRVSGIEFFGKSLDSAASGQSVTLFLEDEVDVSRGDLIAATQGAPTPTQDVMATLCWMSERPLEETSRLLLRHGTSTVRAKVRDVLGRLDLHTQEHLPASDLKMNDIATVSLRLQQPIAPDPYSRVRCGGSFILIDETTNATVAAGLVLEPESF